MKAMKKLWTAICALIFTIALGLGITLSVNVTAKAATAKDMNITWAAIQYDGDAPTRYAFVLNEGNLITPEDYNFYVYFDGQRVPAYTTAGETNIYVDYANFPSDVNDVHLFKMPKGTYYQSGEYTSADCTLLLKNAGWNNEADRFDILTYERISDASFGFGLNMVDWALGANNNSAIYTAIEGGSVIPYGGNGSNENWDVQYASVGNAVTVNGVVANATIVKTHATELAYLAIPAVANAGDTVTVDGWFMNANNNKAFCIEETTFKYDGQAWSEVGVTQEYDLVLSTTVNGGHERGIYASMAPNDIPVNSEDTWAYQTKACGGAKGILYNGTAIDTCLHKWSVGDWYVNLDAVGINAKAGDVVTVFGWFYCNGDGSGQKLIKINPTTFTFNGTTWSQENAVISVSVNGTAVETQQIYVMPGESANAITATATGSMFTDTTVTTVYEYGAVKDGKFMLRDGESSSAYSVTFSVKDKNNVVYKKEMVVRVGFEDFVMENGASVRVLKNGETTEVNGLRFIAELSKDTYENLKAQNATFGMVIVPRDYITAGYELTAKNLFGANAKWQAVTSSADLSNISSGKKGMIQITDLVAQNIDEDDRYELCGAIRNILAKNLTREFVGVAYVYVGDTYILASYYGNDMENNARSIYYVAQKAIEANNYKEELQSGYINKHNDYLDGLGASYNVTYTVNYIKTENGKTVTETETVNAKLNDTITLNAAKFDGFTLTSAAMLTSKLYANKPNVFNFYYKGEAEPSYDSVAWYYPALDDSNGYDNAHNDAIAQTMKAAGFTMVNLAGKNNININSETNVEAMKQIIAMFNRNGLKSVVYTSNASNSEMFGNTTLPDFSDCAGFAGLLVWDEPHPTTAAMNRLAEYAVWFNEVYGESTEEMPFMVNLFPSYASFTSGDYKSYSAYIKAYCDIVLSQVEGTKYLSTDTYPIMADGTLKENFLYDLAVLKAYAMDYDAFVHACLQSSGWDEGNTTQAKAPTEEQMRLQLYTALAFGMDSVSWFTYSPSNDSITNQSPVDFAGNKNEAVYNAMQAVNTDLATFGSLYKMYDWKGVIMSSPAKGGLFGIGQDAQYNAYNKVKSASEFSKYLLSANNTKAFSSVSGSGNYIIGVMEDTNGNEAFTVVNYSAIKDNKLLSLTLTGAVNANYTIYVDGVAQEVTIGTSGYTLNLNPGQGAFIVSADVKATVTFKNWDGTVLQESKVTYGEMPVYTGAIPTREGYEFAGWSPAISAATRDVTYTAKFAKNCTVTFVDYDGTVIETKVVLGGSTVESVTTSNDPYIFKEWTMDGVAFDFNTPITEDITLVATWQMLVESVKPTEKIYTFISTSDSNISTSARFELVQSKADSWYQDDQEKPYGGFIQATFDTVDGEGWIVLPKINYALYSEVSFAIYGSSNTQAVQVGINDNSATLDNSGGIYYVVEIHGKNVELHQMNNAENVLFTATLTDAQYNGTEGLKIDVVENGWSCVQISHILGTQAYEIKDVSFYTVTFADYDGTVIETKDVVNGTAVDLVIPTHDMYIFKAWTKDGVAFDFNTPITEDITLVATWQMLVESVKPTEKIYTFTSAADLNVTGTLNKSIGTKGDDWYQDDQGVNYEGYYNMTFDLGDGDYTITLPKVSFILYSEVSFGLYVGYPDGAAISVTINGQTCSTLNGYYVVEINGKNLNIHKMNEPENVLLTATLTDAQYNGTEALTLNVTESGWNSIQISHILGTQAYKFVDVASHVVTFVDYDGTVIETKDVVSGIAVDPVILDHDMYIFKAWTKDGVAFDFNTPIMEDITLVATWQMLVESVKPTEKIYTYTSAADLAVTGSLNTSIATKGDDWYQDDQGVKYEGYYNMTFDLGDGDYVVSLTKINYSLYSEVSFGLYVGYPEGAAISVTINGQTCSTLNGYYVVEINGKNLNIHKMNEPASVLLTATLTDAQYNGTEALTLNITESGWSSVQISHILGTQAYELKDVVSHKVTFTNMAGEDVVQSISTGNKVERPEDPTRPNCIFGGWYTEYGEEFDFDAGISEDTVIVAHWYTFVESVKPTEKIYTFTSTSDSNVTTSARFESVQSKADSWYQDDQEKPYGGFIQATFDGSADGAGWVVLPKINYALYSEVSFAVYASGAANAVQVSINGSSATLDNGGGIYYVVEIHGKNVDLHQMNNAANVLLTATLTDAQYNGIEGLKIDVVENGWSCVQVSHILGTQAYVIEEVTECNLTEESTVDEYIAYMQKVNSFTAYEKSLYVEPAIVATLRAKYATTEKIYTFTSAADLSITGSLNTSIGTRADDWYQDDQGVNYDGYYSMVFDKADGDYTATLPKINYSIYSEVSFGLYVGYPEGAAISVTINGQTCSTLDGYYVVEINGKNLNIHKMNEPENVLLTATLTDAQYNGTEALTLNVMESGWSNVQISHILGTLA